MWKLFRYRIDVKKIPYIQLCMNWLNTWSRLLPVKLLVPYLVKKIPVLNGPQKFIIPFKGGYPVVSQIRDYIITVDTTKLVTV
jgi:hypothetical protein